MNTKITATLCVGVFSLGLAASAEATLISRLGGLAVYDTDLNITWLADANAGAGSAFDDGGSASDGRMTWNNANAWAASLTVGGFSDWRLPTTPQFQASCDSQNTFAGNSSGFNCTESEMGHLYYIELGALAGPPFATTADPTELAKFVNIQPYFYWTGTLRNAGVAWDFTWLSSNNSGYTQANGTSNFFNAFAVRDGDVESSEDVPEPTTLALLGLGLAGLGFRAKRKPH